MNFTNDTEKAIEYLKSQGACAYYNLPPADLLEKLDRVSHDCMAAYDQQPGDRELVGWIPYATIEDQREDQPLKDRSVDGFCYVGDDGRAVIGISADLLETADHNYLVAGIGLHEVCHLRHEHHDNGFVSTLLQLQYCYFQLQQAHEAKEKLFTVRCDTRPYHIPKPRGKFV